MGVGMGVSLCVGVSVCGVCVCEEDCRKIKLIYVCLIGCILNVAKACVSYQLKFLLYGT